MGKIRNQGVKEKHKKKKLFLKTCIFFLRVDKTFLTLWNFESKIFLTKSKVAGILNPDHSKLQILTHKQMFQRLTIALAQVKVGNNSEYLLSQIR